MADRDARPNADPTVADRTAAAADGAGAGADQAEVEPTWRRSLGDVVVMAVLAVAVVLGAAALTGFLPEPVQRIVFHTPLAIGVLVVGTGWLLWRIARKPAGDGR